MMDAGYTVVHNVLDAHAYGVPQTRLRLFMVGTADGQMWVPPREWPVDDRRTVYDALCDILGRDDVDLPNHEPSIHRRETVERIESMWSEGRWSLYDGFTQSWARLALDLPAPTQTENHGGLCIHPEEPRVITAREMARLQSFPDEWVFHGSKREVLVQIGNAVPVGLARAVAESVLPMLSGGCSSFREP
jgi:DNA (cytosine-5)-methyltransferase 1